MVQQYIELLFLLPAEKVRQDIISKKKTRSLFWKKLKTNATKSTLVNTMKNIVTKC